jgi:hypothetical protein
MRNLTPAAGCPSEGSWVEIVDIIFVDVGHHVVVFHYSQGYELLWSV